MDQLTLGPIKEKVRRLFFDRLDRCLANVDWCHHFPNTTVYHLPLIYGDHAPILVLLNPNFRKPKRSFKFENWWLLEEDFNTVAKNSWNDCNGSFVSKTKFLSKISPPGAKRRNLFRIKS